MKTKQKSSTRLIPYKRENPVNKKYVKQRSTDPIIDYLHNASKISENEINQYFAANIFNEIRGKEIDYMCGTPQLMPFYYKVLFVLPPQPLEVFCNAVLEDLQVIFCNKWGEQIIQHLLDILSGRVVKSLSETSEERRSYSAEHITYCDTFLETISNYLMQELGHGNYCSYAIRDCISHLAGLTLQRYDSDDSSKNKSHIRRVTVPKKWILILKEFCEKIISWSNFSEMVFTQWRDVLTACIKGLSGNYPALQQEFITRLANESLILKSTNEKRFFIIFEKSNQKLCKTILQHADEKNFEHIYNTIFKGRLLALVYLEQSYNALILIDACKTKEQFDPIFSELQESFEKILSKHMVLRHIATACKRFKIHKQLFVENISKALLSNSEETSINPQSLILKLNNEFNRLDFKVKTFITFVKEILQLQIYLENQDFVIKARGKDIAEFLLQNEATKQKTLASLKGTFIQLAVSDHGSKILQLLWKNTDNTQHIVIMDELSSQLGVLNSSLAGRNICTVFKVELYKRSPSSWEETINTNL